MPVRPRRSPLSSCFNSVPFRSRRRSQRLRSPRSAKLSSLSSSRASLTLSHSPRSRRTSRLRSDRSHEHFRLGRARYPRVRFSPSSFDRSDTVCVAGSSRCRSTLSRCSSASSRSTFAPLLSPQGLTGLAGWNRPERRSSSKSRSETRESVSPSCLARRKRAEALADPEQVSDPIWWLQGGKYVPFKKHHYESLQAGHVKL